MTFEEAYDTARRDGWRVGVDRMNEGGIVYLRFIVRRGGQEIAGHHVSDPGDLGKSATVVMDQIRRAA